MCMYIQVCCVQGNRNSVYIKSQVVYTYKTMSSMGYCWCFLLILKQNVYVAIR